MLFWYFRTASMAESRFPIRRTIKIPHQCHGTDNGNSEQDRPEVSDADPQSTRSVRRPAALFLRVIRKLRGQTIIVWRLGMINANRACNPDAFFLGRYSL